MLMNICGDSEGRDRVRKSRPKSTGNTWQQQERPRTHVLGSTGRWIVPVGMRISFHHPTQELSI